MNDKHAVYAYISFYSLPVMFLVPDYQMELNFFPHTLNIYVTFYCYLLYIPLLHTVSTFICLQ